MSSSLVGPTSGCSNRPSTISRAAFWIYSCARWRSEEHTSELQSRLHLVCRLLLEKKKNDRPKNDTQHLRPLCLPVLVFVHDLHRAHQDQHGQCSSFCGSVLLHHLH